MASISWRCNQCNGSHVWETNMMIDMNTGEIQSDGSEDRYYCRDCDEKVSIYDPNKQGEHYVDIDS